MMLVPKSKDELVASELGADGKKLRVLLACKVGESPCKPVCMPPKGQSHFASLIVI